MSAVYDVAIVGGSHVGATLACALGEQGLRVAVIEGREPVLEWEPGSVDLRVFAITQASQRIFTGLGAWQAMAASSVSPFRQMRVWDATGSGAIHFDSAEIGAPYLGHIVESRVIQAALYQRIQQLATTVDWLCPAELAAMEQGPEAVDLALEDGRTLQARLLVGADGAESRVRGLAAIPVHQRDYHQEAIVAVITTGQPHQETAWQRFLPTGPLAFLPLADGRSSIVWSTTPGEARRLLELDEAAFNDALGDAFDHRLGQIIASGPRVSFPLRRQHAEAYTGHRLALVGDAAHTIHPLAGQGVNLGLLDAATLAEVVLEAVAAGRDPGSERALRRYERWRKGDNLAMMTAMDGFKHLFGSGLAPVRLARNLGLRMVDAATPVKGAIIRQAMGLAGDLPRLARGA